MNTDLLQELERRITHNEQTGLRARWEFGRELLLHRKGKKLPKDMLAQIVQQVRVSRQEIQARMKFAERYPDADALSNAVGQFPTCHAMVRYGLTDKPCAPRATVNNDTPAERLLTQLSDLNPEDVADPQDLAVGPTRAQS